MFKINNKTTGTTSLASLWCLRCKFLTYFTPCSSVSIANFETINAGWGGGVVKVYDVDIPQTVISEL